MLKNVWNLYIFSFQVQKLVEQTSRGLQKICDDILKRIDDMGRRIDDIEKNIDDLLVQVEAQIEKDM